MFNPIIKTISFENALCVTILTQAPTNLLDSYLFKAIFYTVNCFVN